MKVADLYGDKPVYSLEAFPPRNGESLDDIYHMIDELLPFSPAFVSVTGGALGSERGGTIAIAALIKRKYNIEGVVHFTCADKSKQDIENMLIEIKFSGIENVLALRGDPPAGEKKFVPHPEGHKFASELTEQISLLNEGKFMTSEEDKYRMGEPLNFGVGVGGYPEGHIECPDREQDIENLKAKIDNGADYIVTQMFLDADYYLDFAERAKKAGINIPIVPGVMPIARYSQVKFVLRQLGIGIPKAFEDSLESHKDDKDYIKKACEEHTINMVKKLLEGGAPGIQFFTMNKPGGTRKIFQELLT